MSSELKIGYPDIPFRAIKMTPAQTAQTNFDDWNMIAGWPGTSYQRQTADTTVSWDFDMGPSQTASANYLYIHRNYYLKNTVATTTIQLQHSADASSWTSALLTSSASLTAGGPDGQDWLTTFTATASRRYFRFNMAAGASSLFSFSKVLFGTLWDPDNSANYSFDIIVPDEAGSYSSSGAAQMWRGYRELYRFGYTWEGLTDAVVQTFLEKIARWSRLSPVVLYSPTITQNLAGNSHMYAWLTDYTVLKDDGVTDRNTLRASFQQAL